MSWSATKHAWRCSRKDAGGDEIVKGSVKLLMLAVAYRIPISCYESEPTSLQGFHDLTGIHERQLRSCRHVLIGLGELEQRGASQFATYVFPKMLGPLFATTESIPKSGKDCRPNRQLLPTGPAKIAAKIADPTGLPAGGVLSLDLTSTTVLRTTTDDEAEVVEAFLDWFLGEYPKHRHGILYVVKHPGAAETVARNLLKGRSLDRVQNMARAMWAERQDEFILTSDYSLHILEHCALRLETKVVERERRGTTGPHGAQLVTPGWTCPMCDATNPAALRVCGCGEGRPVQREGIA